MARKTTPEAYARLVETARGFAPDAAITTDLIVGFPGESAEDHQESLEFVRNIDFAGGHVFTYSVREGTAAARLGDFVDGKIARARSAELRGVISEAGASFKRRFVGQICEVLWESSNQYGPQGWRLHGLTGNYIKVESVSQEKVWNKISAVQLNECSSDGLAGEILSSR